MLRPYRDAASFRRALVDMAEEFRRVILAMADSTERFDRLMRLVADSDMVFAVWPDPSDGFGIQVIKGEDMMPPLIGFETAEEIKLAAIPCAGWEIAMVVRETWSGAGPRRTPSPDQDRR